MIREAFAACKEKLTRLSFSTKLVITYIIILAVPLMILTFGIYASYARNSIQQAVQTNEKVIRQAAAYLEYKLMSLNTMIDVISYDVTIQNILKTGTLQEREMQGNWFIQKVDNRQNIIFNPYVSREIQSVRIYPLSGSFSFEQTDEFLKLPLAVQQNWKERLDEAPTFNPVWIPVMGSGSATGTQAASHAPSENISILKKVPDFGLINKSIGIIKGEIPLSVFQDIIEQTITTEGTFAVLMNSYGESIAAIGTDRNGLLDIPLYTASLPADGSMHAVTAGDRSRYLVGTIPIERSDWVLSMFVPERAILSLSIPYRQQLMLLVILLFFASVPLIFYTSKTVTARIKKLQRHVDKVSSQGFLEVPLDNGMDEIGQLTVSFDSMAGKISELLKNQFQLGYRIKDLEFRVLQSTINPHFLYNSLDLIHWTALQKHDEDISRMARSLSRFYKLSLGHGQFIVPLRDEIELVKTYVDIQNMRFDGKITLDIHIPEQVLDFPVFKLLLQPLVENAILHGIREKENETGRICISAAEENGDFILTVSDDGIGMTPAQVKSLLSSTAQATSGYGIRNIHERIQLVHGKEYGLHFSSRLWKGTSVTIRLKKGGVDFGQNENISSLDKSAHDF